VSRYEVDPAELQACDAMLDEVSAGARAALDGVCATAAALLDDRWRGGSAAAFRLGWEQWLDGVAAMLVALDELAATVGLAAAGYRSTEDAVRASVARSSA
jgi:WXG100 family type VII secretion target